MKTTVFVLLLGLSALAGFSKNNTASGSSGFNEEKEKKAILESLTAETENFYKRDYEGVIKYYVHADYAYHSWNNSDGTFSATIGWPAINEKFKNYIKENPVPEGSTSNPKVERRNMIFKFFSPSVAFVTWDQYNGDTESKTYRLSRDSRIMEKQYGLWKIANMTSFWDYKNLVPVESLK
ncbi:MAG TPA: hypothetical protein VLQ91_14260 [Draconibacterium sp.]|nr:hypothetical protein [Draconibacterium sp.]